MQVKKNHRQDWAWSVWRLELLRGRGWGGWQESSQIPGFTAQDPPRRHQGGRERKDTNKRLVEKDEGTVSTSEALQKEGKNHSHKAPSSQVQVG